MKKAIPILMCGLSVCVSAHGQADVTSDFLTNPSFEADAAACTPGSPQAVNNAADGLRGWDITPAGWNATTPDVALLINADCFTDNNFGKTDIPDGEFAYYQRFGWGNANSEMNQTTSAPLPEGEYELKFFTKAFAANNAATQALVAVRDA